ncbi:MAG: pirin family protein [Verrucomicrobiota bacterium]
MITKHLSDERGRSRFDWLDSRHSFSFGQYQDPERVQHGPLRVLNEDRVAPGAGFPTHPHRNMEILTYVLEGTLRHADSTGHEADLRAGQFQAMTAGAGLTHSEFNPSPDEPVHFLQIWILPRQPGLRPRYADAAPGDDPVRLLASPDGREGSLAIAQDAHLYRLRGDARHGTFDLPAEEGELGWLQIASGSWTLGADQLAPGDALEVRGETGLKLTNEDPGEALWFRLPGNGPDA